MKTVLIEPHENCNGNLLWAPPYLYPESGLTDGLEQLKAHGYRVSLLPEEGGITFSNKNQKTAQEILGDFRFVFPWMEIKLQEPSEEVDFENYIFKHQIVVLPVARLKIDRPILNSKICLFPPGEFEVHKIALKNLEGNVLESKSSTRLRDYITELTEINLEVFESLPLVVIKRDITKEDYLSLNHFQDIELIKECSQYSDQLFDLLRFYEGDYNFSEFLPSKAGMWNDRYSTVLIYFPKYKSGFLQAREVETKTFIKGIGMEFTNVDLISIHPLLEENICEVGHIAKHALRLNTQILELDNETMKFIQLMILFEYLGNPNAYEAFKKLKGRFITCLANNKEEYHFFSETFKYYSESIRTPIIHLGKRLEEIILSSDERKRLFKEMQIYIKQIINDLIFNFNLTWEEYYNLREERRNKLLF